MVFQKEGDIMHKYMRTIGFSQYTSRQDLNKLLKKLVKDASKSDILKESDGEMFANCGHRPLRHGRCHRRTFKPERNL